MGGTPANGWLGKAYFRTVALRMRTPGLTDAICLSKRSPRMTVMEFINH